MRVAVVGAGIMGTCSAYSLAKRGHEVTQFDAFPAHHSMGSSHGNSRIIRKAYPDSFYTQIMTEAYPMWSELQSQIEEVFVHESGLLCFGKSASETLIKVNRSLEENGVNLHHHDAESLGRKFPNFRFDEDECGSFTSEGGWVQAEIALRSIQHLAQSLGVSRIETRVDRPLDLRSHFGRIVLCMGAWIKEVVPLPLKITKQTFCYFDVDRPQVGPAWIDDTAPMYYGFPSEPGSNTIKIGIHNLGDPIDPRSTEREPNPQFVEQISTYAARRFGIEGDLMQSAHACLYSRTTNEDFLWGRLDNSTIWCSPCSGHGFKFGPWIGERMADMVEGTLEPSAFPRFCLDSSLS